MSESSSYTDEATAAYEPIRVLIDEVAVTEAIRPRVGFRGVGAFRSDMNGLEEVPGVPSEAEQPLCNEGWGVQCEIFKAQLPDKIDLDSTNYPPVVILHWYPGEDVWGYSNWKTNSAARHVELMRAQMPEGATGTSMPVPTTRVTEELLRSGRACMLSSTSYQVNKKMDGFSLLVALTAPDGSNYRYESQWYYDPEIMGEDEWYVSMMDTGLLDMLNQNGYPDGIYEMAMYIDGKLADSFSFELIK